MVADGLCRILRRMANFTTAAATCSSGPGVLCVQLPLGLFRRAQYAAAFLDLPAGCAFAARCEMATDICSASAVELRGSASREVRCVKWEAANG